RHARAHRDRADVVELRRTDALDDRARNRDGVAGFEPRQEDGEFVAPQPEALAALPQSGGDLSEHAVADRVPMSVVDLLEVVDVHEAEAERTILLLRRGELTLQPLVEMA